VRVWLDLSLPFGKILFMRKAWLTAVLLAAIFILEGFGSDGSIPPEAAPGKCESGNLWGFFAHRRINRLAVLTLPPEMMVFFKPHIDWISDHATDPDMRRYATPWEGPRHFIDLDEHGTPPFEGLPRTFTEALLQYTDIRGVTAAGDTVLLFGGERAQPYEPSEHWRGYFARHIVPLFTDPEKLLNPDTLAAHLRLDGLEMPPVRSAFFQESLSAHGVLPWHLQKMQRDLTNAFRRRDTKRILRLSADMGHYIGDAHVPLHTTSNYNGQKTGQIGIHGFWESRIPELFADEQYDYFVGKPQYIARPTDYFWDMILTSNSMVDSVLGIERRMRTSFPQDRQMCPDMRGKAVVITQCRDFADAYQSALDGMVEHRLRGAIHAVACSWYTAWVDAGQPDLSQMDPPVASEEEQKEEEELKKKYGEGRILGRAEEH